MISCKTFIRKKRINATKTRWWLTTSTGKNWVAYQPKEYGKFYKEFTAKTPQEAKAIALQTIQNFEK